MIAGPSEKWKGEKKETDLKKKKHFLKAFF